MNNKINSAWKEFANVSIIFRDITNKTCSSNDENHHEDMNRLTIAQAKVANYIFEHNTEDIMLKDIAKSVKVTPGAASQMVDFLVKKGLVVRKQNENDRRAVIISLSDKGKEIIDNARETFEVLAKDIFDGISQKDEETFVRVLKHVYARLIEKRNSLENYPTAK